jgi:hypothetical protein
MNDLVSESVKIKNKEGETTQESDPSDSAKEEKKPKKRKASNTEEDKEKQKPKRKKKEESGGESKKKSTKKKKDETSDGPSRPQDGSASTPVHDTESLIMKSNHSVSAFHVHPPPVLQTNMDEYNKLVAEQKIAYVCLNKKPLQESLQQCKQLKWIGLQPARAMKQGFFISNEELNHWKKDNAIKEKNILLGTKEVCLQQTNLPVFLRDPSKEAKKKKAQKSKDSKTDSTNVYAEEWFAIVQAFDLYFAMPMALLSELMTEGLITPITITSPSGFALARQEQRTFLVPSHYIQPNSSASTSLSFPSAAISSSSSSSSSFSSSSSSSPADTAAIASVVQHSLCT